MSSATTDNGLSIGDIVRFLFGGREAILKIADTRKSLWIGFLFVMSAAFAREYDGHDLLRGPGVLLAPLVASVVSSFLLFLLVYCVDWWKGDWTIPFGKGYLSFLSLYWMTAPLAWLYAIPVERFMSEYNAAIANLCLLSVVSIWRVVLMVRVVQVVVSAIFLAALSVVMLFADSVAIVVLFQQALGDTVMRGMSGIHSRTDVDRLVAIFSGNVLFLGTLTWLVWLAGTFFVVVIGRVWECILPEPNSQARVRPGLWRLAIASVAIWAAILPFTQRDLVWQTAIEDAVQNRDYAAAIKLIKEHSSDDIQPYWASRVKPSPFEHNIWKAIELCDSEHAPNWLKRRFVEQFSFQRYFDWPEDPEEKARLLALLEGPHGVEMLRGKTSSLEFIIKREKDEQLKQRIIELLNTIKAVSNK